MFSSHTSQISNSALSETDRFTIGSSSFIPKVDYDRISEINIIDKFFSPSGISVTVGAGRSLLLFVLNVDDEVRVHIVKVAVGTSNVTSQRLEFQGTLSGVVLNSNSHETSLLETGLLETSLLEFMSKSDGESDASDDITVTLNGDIKLVGAVLLA